jgi:hypothetical protein
MTTNGKREAPAAVGRHPSAERIEEDHHALGGQLDAVAAATGRTALVEALAPLPAMLQEHFALEEQFDGFYDDLLARRPSMASALDALRDEHRVILDECDSLCRQLEERMRAERSVEEIADDTKRDVARLLDSLRRHEHQESVMMGDAYYTDE